MNLGSGAYFYLPAAAEHATSCTGAVDCVFLIHQDGPFVITMGD